MSLTRQEAADALVETGLDAASLEALLQALKSVSATGWGEVTLDFQKQQIINWEVRQTGIVERKQK